MCAVNRETEQKAPGGESSLSPGSLLGGAPSWSVSALERQKRRKSPLNLILASTGLLSVGGFWLGLGRLAWEVHVLFHPGATFREFSGKELTFPGFLMIFSLGPSALFLGFLSANFVFWSIPGARRILEIEARGFPGSSFRKSNLSLLKYGKWIVPAGLLLSIAGAWLLAPG